LGSGEIAWSRRKAVRLGPAWARALEIDGAGYQPDGVAWVDHGQSMRRGMALVARETPCALDTSLGERGVAE
jgi:hypothetical protein